MREEKERSQASKFLGYMRISVSSTDIAFDLLFKCIPTPEQSDSLEALSQRYSCVALETQFIYKHTGEPLKYFVVYFSCL